MGSRPMKRKKHLHRMIIIIFMRSVSNEIVTRSEKTLNIPHCRLATGQCHFPYKEGLKSGTD